MGCVLKHVCEGGITSSLQTKWNLLYLSVCGNQMTDDANVLRVWCACVFIRVMCQVIELLTCRRCNRCYFFSTHISIFDTMGSVTPPMCLLFLLWACACYTIWTVCLCGLCSNISSSPESHKNLLHHVCGPETLCGCICICIYTNASVPVCAHLPLLAAFIHYLVCVFGMYDEMPLTHTLTQSVW